MSAFSEGYSAYAKNVGVINSAFIGDIYVDNVESSIDALVKDMNALKYNKDGSINNTGIDYLKGRVAEHWHEGTFNIDAAVKGSALKASKVPEMPGSEGLGAPDVQVSNGDIYGLKYYNTAAASAEQQAKSVWERYNEYLSKCRQDSKEPLSYDEYTASLNNPNKNAALYEGQYRLIPSDQFDNVRSYLQRRIAEESVNRPELAAKYQETLDMLVDRVKAGKVESIPLTETEAKELAKLLKEDGFDPADYGITTEDLIKWDNIMEQAFQAGLSAALISIVLEVAPELINVVTKAIREGEVSLDDFKRVGFAAIKGGTLGYVRGTFSAALTIACKSGKLGSALKSVNPAFVGTVVALTMNALQNAVLMSIGNITKQEFAHLCIQDLAIASFAMAFGTAFQAVLGTAFQTLLPQLPVLGFMLGSFVGSVIGSLIYKTAYNCVISYCIDTGCTFFRLVEQDYTLPEEVLRKLGVRIANFRKSMPKQTSAKRIGAKRISVRQIEPKKIDITFLRRGVIAVNCIGYV